MNMNPVLGSLECSLSHDSPGSLADTGVVTAVPHRFLYKLS